MILIKLGGSVITDKSKPLCASRQSILKMARSITKITEPVIIVHGGGSFGHYWSVKYDMHTKAHNYDTKGVAIVKESMIQLNTIILEQLLKGGMRPYTVAPAGFMSGNKPIPSKILEMNNIATLSDMTPITYGDAMWYGNNNNNKKEDNSYKTYILSGDKIMTHLAHILKPRLCIFVLSEDGLYIDLESKKLIKHIPATKNVTKSHTKNMKTNVMDVTGGMTRKVNEAKSITKYGTSVAFVNGNYPKRIQDAATSTTYTTATNNRFKGTLFEACNLKEKNNST